MTEREHFIAALNRPDDDARRAYLDGVCGDDPGLRGRLETLLREHDALGSFLEGPADGAASPTFPNLEIGTRIGPYRILEALGEGGMGVVYRAEQDQPVRREVALKVIKPGMDTRQVIARFEAERQTLALMDHPNIARVLDAGATESGRPYFVMELVKGPPITGYCDRARLSIDDRLDLFVLVCQAVQHAHQKGIIHRDLKPSNVLVTVIDGVAVPKVIDFGVAKATGGALADPALTTGLAPMIGTPLYMSPEQAEPGGLDIDTRTDIYSLGVLLYELLTGTTPFDADAMRRAAFDEMRRMIREDEPPTPSTRLSGSGRGPVAETVLARSAIAEARGIDPAKLSKRVRGELDWIVMKALEKDRTRRYETASAFAADVMRYRTDRPVEAGPPSAWYRFVKYARRNRAALGVVASLAAALVLTIAGLAVGLIAVTREQAKTAEAEGKVREALEALEPGLRRGNPHAADVVRAARQAEAHLAGDLVRPELRGQSQRLLADLSMLAELERIRLDQAAVKDGHFDIAGADAAYAAAFRSYAVDVDALSPAEAGTRLRDRAIAEHLAAALDGWAMARKGRAGDEDPGWRRLMEAAGEADPEPGGWRAGFREAIARHVHGEELRKVAAAAPLGEMSATSLNLLGDLLSNEGEVETAVSVRRAGQRRYPADFWLNHQLAYDLTESHPPQWDEAIGYYRAALALRPESPGVHLNLGNALRMKGRLDEAIACLEEALRLKPDYAEAHHNLGNLLPAVGRSDEAIAHFLEAIRLKPDDSWARNGLGNLLRDKGRLDEVVASLREAIRLQPDDAAAHYNLGLTMLAQGHTDQALACFHEALRIQPDFPNARIALDAVRRARRASPVLPFPQGASPMAASLINSLSTRPKPTARRPQAEALEGRLLLTAGDLDLSFGTAGYVLTNSPAVARDGSPVGDKAYAVAIQPDGKILAAGDRQGSWGFEVVRLNPDGAPDPGFGTGGRVVQLHNGPSQAYDMAVDSAGRILLAGYTKESGGGPGNNPDSDVALVRLRPDGVLDSTFGPSGDGKVITDVSSLGLDDEALAVAIQPDGKIVVGGHAGGGGAEGFDGLLLRYNADGSLDESFGVSGKVVTSWAMNRDDKITDVAIQADGKIMVCGSVKLEDGSGRYGRYLARYNADGSLDDRSVNDTTPDVDFGIGGRVDLPFSTSYIGYWEHPIAIQDDGAIVWVGHGFNGADDDVAVARLTTTGAFDATFGAVSGAARTGSATIPLAGRNGARSVTIQEDGKLVVVGQSETDSLIARFGSDGTLDPGFGSGGIVVRSFSSGSSDILYDVAIQGDGRIVAAGTATPPGLTRPAFLIARFEGISPPGIAVSPTSGLVTTEGGGPATFTAVLTTRPTADVAIPVQSGNPAEGTVSTSLLTFTPADWDVPQTVTITGVDDLLADGDVAYDILLGAPFSADPAYSVLDPAVVAATNIDNETKFYVVDDGSPDRTYEYGPAGSAVENYALNGGNTAPRGAAGTAAGDKVWVVDANKNVYVYNTAGTLLGSWTAGTLASNATVEGIATNGTDVWIVDARQDKVFRYAGAASRLSGSQNAASSFNLNSGNTGPKDVVTDGTSLWVVNDASTDKVFQYNLSGSLLGSWTITGAGTSPTGITLDPSGGGHLWMVDSGTDRVYQFDDARGRTSGSQAPSTYFALAAGNTNPQGLADPPAPGSLPAVTARRDEAAPRTDHTPRRPAATVDVGWLGLIGEPRIEGPGQPTVRRRPSAPRPDLPALLRRS